MQKFWNIASVIIIAGLGFWIFMLIRANGKWKELILKRIIIESDTPPVTNTTTPAQKNITMGEMWEALQQKVGQIKVELDLK